MELTRQRDALKRECDKVWNAQPTSRPPFSYVVQVWNTWLLFPQGSRALSEARLERRELEWAVGDLRWGTPRSLAASGGLVGLAGGLQWPEGTRGSAATHAAARAADGDETLRESAGGRVGGHREAGRDREGTSPPRAWSAAVELEEGFRHDRRAYSLSPRGAPHASPGLGL